jgi:hypothetical protein
MNGSGTLSSIYMNIRIRIDYVFHKTTQLQIAVVDCENQNLILWMFLLLYRFLIAFIFHAFDESHPFLNGCGQFGSWRCNWRLDCTVLL